jgi:uncharacterized membrane protein YfbV (UPF0208 family)
VKVKLGAAAVAFVLGAGEQFVNSGDGVFGTIVLMGAVVGALYVIFTKVISPLIALGKRVDAGIEALFVVAEWKPQVEERLKEGEARLDALEGKPAEAPKALPPGAGSPSTKKA